MFTMLWKTPPLSVTLLYSLPTLFLKIHVSHAHGTLNLASIWPAVSETTAIFEFPGAHGGAALTLLLPGNPENNPAKLFCVQIERTPDRTTESMHRKQSMDKKIFMCPNKLHKDFSSRERERDVENTGVGRRGGGRRRMNFLTGMLTYDFSLCLIQCAISRCIIYFCVKSLTAVTCHYDDIDDDDGASFSRHKDVTLDMVLATVLNVSKRRGRPSDLLGSRPFIMSQLQ